MKNRKEKIDQNRRNPSCSSVPNRTCSIAQKEEFGSLQNFVVFKRWFGIQLNPHFMSIDLNSHKIQTNILQSLTSFSKCPSTPTRLLLHQPLFLHCCSLLSSVVWSKVIDKAYDFCEARMQAETELTLIFHHGGDFIKFGNADFQYIGGQMCVWERLEADFLNKFDLEAMVKKCGSYFNINHIWYLLPEMNNLDGLREVVNDKDFMDMVSVAKDNNNEIELYFEHGMEVPTIIVPASDEDIDDEPVQNEVDMPEVEVQNDDDMPEVEVQNDETVVDGDYDAETEVDGDSDTNVDGDSDAENANLDAAFNWHNDDEGEVQENIIHQNVIPSSSDEEWNSYHSEELKSPISTDDEGEGVRPPPIRAPPNMYRVPLPGETSSAVQGFMTFMPTPRAPGYMSWYFCIFHPYMSPLSEGDDLPRPCELEAIIEEEAKLGGPLTARMESKLMSIRG
ncbi:hypothetical protein P8452_51910 [Trifolium repens]|nr:hypothetical protein P8452_51910 [Trifolium repens]